jgi:hypothetical protein
VCVCVCVLSENQLFSDGFVRKHRHLFLLLVSVVCHFVVLSFSRGEERTLNELARRRERERERESGFATELASCCEGGDPALL